MTNLQQNIEQQVSIFVNNVSDLVRQAAICALEQAMSVSVVPAEGARHRRRQPDGRGGARKQRAARKPAPARDSAEVSALTERLYEAIAAQPGKPMEVLAASVGCPARDLRVSIGHLVKRERVKKAGQRRATRYFPMDGDRS
jgi:hypothetical protein